MYLTVVKVLLWSQTLLISNSCNHNKSTDLQFIIIYQTIAGFLIFLLHWKRFKMKRHIAYVIWQKWRWYPQKLHFQVLYINIVNNVPILIKISKKNYCFWIKSQFILTFIKKEKITKLCTLNPRYLSTFIDQN